MGVLLETINSPADVKRLEPAKLKALAEEIRQFIIESVSRNGGHLASNLGIVELTLALHYVFDFAKDKLLWDVGHQCYAHKILTGRKTLFERLRKPEGVGGFPDPAESEYDQFVVGHAGTAIPTAIGMALGQWHRKQNDKVVAIVGDASIVNGVSFEGLNNLGLVKRQLLIVLNDNSMAIDATVGALAKYFSRLRLSQTYEDLRKTTSGILEHLPVFGKGMEEALERVKKGIRMALPASQMFESMNIPYFGPVDGHDVESLIKLFRAFDHLEHPAILHVYTKKGMGFHPAGSTPTQFHSTGPFKINGKTIEPQVYSGRETFTEAFGRSLTALAQEDERIVAITSAMCDGTGLGRFRKAFPDRFYDVGIAESAAVDIAAGLCRSGLRPVVCIYSTFLQRSFDQVFQEVALQNLPVVFCVDRAGCVGSDGPTHHGLMDIGYLRMMPNLVLTAPSNAVEMQGALAFALSHGGPVVIRYPKDVVPPDESVNPACAAAFECGRSIVVHPAEDADLYIVNYGSLLAEALEAAQLLAGESVSVEVVNARFAAPIDERLVELTARGKPVVTVEDHSQACGFGSALLEAAAQPSAQGAGHKGRRSKARNRPAGGIRVLGVGRSLIGRDSRGRQLMESGLNAEEIATAARGLLQGLGASERIPCQR